MAHTYIFVVTWFWFSKESIVEEWDTQHDGEQIEEVVVARQKNENLEHNLKPTHMGFFYSNCLMTHIS